MPITKSAQKAMRVSLRKRRINLQTAKKYKTAVKAVRRALAVKQKQEILKALPAAYKELDKAAKKHVIHPNKAARLKSRLTSAAARLS